MRRLVAVSVAGLLAGAGCWAQEPAPSSQEKPTQGEQQESPAKPETEAQAPEETATAPSDNGTITVPAGTRVALALINPVFVRHAHKGDSVRAVTTFPVSVGTQLAIPAGTYLQGAIEKVTKRGRAGRGEIQVRFTRLVFPNGYAVPLDGAVAEAANRVKREAGDDSSSRALSGAAKVSGYALGWQGLQQPPPTPLPLPPSPGPKMGTIIAVTVGSTAALFVAALVFHYHRGPDTILDTGWNFEMILGAPITVDLNQVSAPIDPSATPN